MVQEMPTLPHLPLTFDKVVDSGTRTEFTTGSKRDVQTGKGRPDLIPPAFLRRLAKHYENGATKYGDRNWEKGQPLSQFYASAFRHMLALAEGKADEDHASAAIWNLISYMEIQRRIANGQLPKELSDFPPESQIVPPH